MKRLVIIPLILICSIIYAQDLYNLGLNYFQKGEYYIADSLFSIYLIQNPKDLNAHFDSGIVKFYLGDTCSFCKEMYSLSHYSSDKEAYSMYIQNCGKSDTVYYEKDFASIETKPTPYFEIFRSHKCFEFKTIVVHGKTYKESIYIKGNYLDATSQIENNIIAVYRQLKNENKIFLYTLTPPTFPLNGQQQTDYRINSPLIKQAKKEFNLKNVVVTLEYIVDIDGRAKDARVINISKSIDRMDEFKKYINLIVLGMPIRNPAKYQNQNVEYLLMDYISF